MLWQWLHTTERPLLLSEKIKLSVTGVLAFAADTFGIGSFTVNVAMAKLLKTFPDHQLPALVNGVQVIPGFIIALFYFYYIHVDFLTLVSLVVATSLGAITGTLFFSRLTTQTIRLFMIISFLIILASLFCHHIHWIPDEGDASILRGRKLLTGFCAMFVCGALTVSGVGLFISVQTVLFILNMSAVIVFPIMTIAGAIQQPLSATVFLYKRQIPLQKSLWIMLPGCVTILILAPLMYSLVVDWLHKVLMLVLMFNVLTIGYDFARDFRRPRLELRQLPTTH